MIKKIQALLFTNRHTRQIVAKNTFWLFFGEIVSRLLRTFFVIYAARILGKEQWGLFSYALSLAAIFMVFADIGLSMLATKAASREGEGREYLSTIFFIKLFLLLASLAAVIVFAPLLSKIPGANPLIPIVALVLFFDSLREFFFALNRGSERMEREGLIKIATNFLVICFGFYLLVVAPSPKNFAWAYLLGSVAGTVLLGTLLRKPIKKLFFFFSKERATTIWHEAWPIAITGFFGGVMLNIDTVMIGYWHGAEQIGLYAASLRLIQLTYMIPGILAIVVLPLFSRLAAIDRTKVAMLLERTMTLALLFGLPIMIGGIILRAEIVTLIFGVSYLEASATLAILLTTILAVFPNLILMNAVYALGIQKKFVFPVLVGLIINIILNLLLIPYIGIEGAALGTVIAQFAIVGLNWRLIKKSSGFTIIPLAEKILLASILMMGVTLLIKKMGFGVIFNIGVSSLFYLGALLLLKEKILGEMREIIKT